MSGQIAVDDLRFHYDPQALPVLHDISFAVAAGQKIALVGRTGSGKSTLLQLLLGLYPSIIFWSSILGKDPIAFLGIGMYVFGVVGWSRTSRRCGHCACAGRPGTSLLRCAAAWSASAFQTRRHAGNKLQQ